MRPDRGRDTWILTRVGNPLKDLRELAVILFRKFLLTVRYGNARSREP
jgi:hypothetical protein